MTRNTAEALRSLPPNAGISPATRERARQVSFVAEFARQIHESSPHTDGRPYTPLYHPSKSETLSDIKAVIFDVYGTLIDYWRPDFAGRESKIAALRAAFQKTASRFSMIDALRAINPAAEPGSTLMDFYHGLIGLSHEKSLKKGIPFPEVRIEKVWEIIILMLMRHGYDIRDLAMGGEKDVASCAAYFYNFTALGRGLYPEVSGTLGSLRAANMRLGIVSNAQFYTPIDLTLFIRDQAGGRIDDYLELFDVDLCFYSFEYGAAKPGLALFRKLYDALYQMHILPSQTVFAGNDLVSDIKGAQEVGMKAAFFTGDDKVAFTGDERERIIPDITFSHYSELPSKLSFHEKSTSMETAADA